jgi:inosine-uridine nucleoside N-ribohydrolase
MIHVTDLFRPHNDPDDHWDLACVYSLAYQGYVDLLAILVDYPPARLHTDPDVLAVAQLNYLCGKAVPVMVGSPESIEPHQATKPGNKPQLRGVRAMLDTMRRAPSPVAISVLGSCRDVALAGQLEPDLFANKCAAIYLNAGNGTPDKSKIKRLESNVEVDPKAYAAMFQLPCPIYWLPCFEVAPSRPRERLEVSGFGML